jgi:DNA repair protein RecN (Recombination protein N)
MLTHLQIRDFAIVDSVELELRPGLTVLTGETGAGKSIIVDALQLIAGGRAGAEAVRHGAERAEVSGTFDLSRAPRALKQWLEEQSVASSGELIVRRVIGADGRSRAYLNGQSVPVQLLREAGNILIEIHGQHEFQSLTLRLPRGARGPGRDRPPRMARAPQPHARPREQGARSRREARAAALPGARARGAEHQGR